MLFKFLLFFVQFWQGTSIDVPNQQIFPEENGPKNLFVVFQWNSPPMLTCPKKQTPETMWVSVYLLSGLSIGMS